MDKLNTILSYFKEDDRVDAIRKLIQDYTVERISKSPYGHKRGSFVGVYDGGWVDFMALCILNTHSLSQLYNKDTDPGYSEREILTACFFSQLHKLGFPNGGPAMIPQTDPWRQQNLGEVYTYSSEYENYDKTQLNLQILNNYSIKLNQIEYEAVYNYQKVLDSSGLITFVQGKYFSNLPFILGVSYVKTIDDMRRAEENKD